MRPERKDKKPKALATVGRSPWRRQRNPKLPRDDEYDRYNEGQRNLLEKLVSERHREVMTTAEEFKESGRWDGLSRRDLISMDIPLTI